MPLYEYRCPNGHDFEKFYRSIGTASSEATCPVCGAFGARVMSAAGLVFKGSGFYITDYGKDGKKAEREAAMAGKKKADSAAAAAATTAKAAEAASSGSAASSGESSAAAKSKDTPPAASQPASTPAPAAPASTSKTSE